MMTEKELESKTLDQLAILAERCFPGDAQHILIMEEIAKRRPKYWHEVTNGDALKLLS